MNLLRSVFEPNVRLGVRLRRAILLGLLVAACGYRIWLIVEYNPVDHLWSDPARHWHSGTHPLDTAPMAAIDPIGFQIHIGMLAKLTVMQPLLVGYWTALLSLSGPWLWYRFLRELLPGRDWALAGWVLFAALPSWSAIYSYFMQETLMLPLLGLALWTTWRCRRKADTASFMVAVGAWLAAGLTRGICLPLGAIAMTWLWVAHGRRLASAAGGALLVLAIMVPLSGRSWTIVRLISPHGIGTMAQLYQLSGERNIDIEFTRRGGSERWRYGFASPAADETPLRPLLDWKSRRERTASFSIDLDAGARDWKAAMATLPPLSLQRLAWLTGDNLVRLFFGGSWPDSDLSRTIGRINYALRWAWVPLSLATLGATLVCWRRQRERLLSALILAWFLVQGLMPLAPNEGRYRKPFEGLLLAQCLLIVATRSRRPGVAAIGSNGESPGSAGEDRS